MTPSVKRPILAVFAKNRAFKNHREKKEFLIFFVKKSKFTPLFCQLKCRNWDLVTPFSARLLLTECVILMF
jgi:hypothetical protein